MTRRVEQVEHIAFLHLDDDSIVPPKLTDRGVAQLRTSPREGKGAGSFHTDDGVPSYTRSLMR